MSQLMSIISKNKLEIILRELLVIFMSTIVDSILKHL